MTEELNNQLITNYLEQKFGPTKKVDNPSESLARFCVGLVADVLETEGVKLESDERVIKLYEKILDEIKTLNIK